MLVRISKICWVNSRDVVMVTRSVHDGCLYVALRHNGARTEYQVDREFEATFWAGMSPVLGVDDSAPALTDGQAGSGGES